ncbi:MAG TPA: hypothetical protein VIV06_04065, partial [Candidatus Limnocylindrales bacterium]
MSGRGGGFGRVRMQAGAGPGRGRGRGGPFGGGRFEDAYIPPERRGRTVRRILAFFSPYRLRISIVVAAILVTSLIGLVNPFLLKFLTDEVLVGHDFRNLNLYAGLMIALPIVNGLIGVGQSYMNNLI